MCFPQHARGIQIIFDCELHILILKQDRSGCKIRCALFERNYVQFYQFSALKNGIKRVSNYPVAVYPRANRLMGYKEKHNLCMNR